MSFTARPLQLLPERGLVSTEPAILGSGVELPINQQFATGAPKEGKKNNKCLGVTYDFINPFHCVIRNVPRQYLTLYGKPQ